MTGRKAAKPILNKKTEIEFAIARSHKASEIAYDLAKGIAQTALFINGGAATAIVAFLAKEEVTNHIFVVSAASLGIYGLGTVVSTVAMFLIMQTADHWNYFWYADVYGDKVESEACEAIAWRYHFWFYVAFWVAVGCFMIASGLLAYALITDDQTWKLIAE